MVSYLNFFISVVTMPVPLEKRITEVETSSIVFFEKTTDAYKILYDKRSLGHQFLYFLATLGRLYLLIILVILIGYSFHLRKSWLYNLLALMWCFDFFCKMAHTSEKSLCPLF